MKYKYFSDFFLIRQNKPFLTMIATRMKKGKAPGDFSFLTQTFNQNKQQPYQPTIAAETNTKSLRVGPKHISYGKQRSCT